MGLSIRAYAKHRGLSHTSVRKAVASGRIPVEADGTIDLVKADAAWKANSTPRREHSDGPSATSSNPRPASAPGMKPVPEAAVSAVGETLREQGMPAPSTPGQMTFLQARTANEILKAQERRIRLQKLKGELIDRARATALVFRLARQERDAWLNWPSRVSATMAADLGVDAQVMHTELEKYVRDHLSELADVKPSFR